MRHRFGKRLGLGSTGRFKVRRGQTCSVELPPIAGYGPLPESSWLLILALATLLFAALALR